MTRRALDRLQYHMRRVVKVGLLHPCGHVVGQCGIGRRIEGYVFSLLDFCMSCLNLSCSDFQTSFNDLQPHFRTTNAPFSCVARWSKCRFSLLILLQPPGFMPSSSTSSASSVLIPSGDPMRCRCCAWAGTVTRNTLSGNKQDT